MKQAHKRLLATLTTRAPTSSNALVPPYAHSLPAHVDPIQAGYAHHVEPTESSPDGTGRDRLQAPVRFAVRDDTSQRKLEKGKGKASPFALPEVYRAWAESLLNDERGREELWNSWLESVNALRQAERVVPEAAFHRLSDHLSSDSAIQAVQQSGSLVVRDVLPDAEVARATREVLQATIQRSGRPLFWHKSLLELRGHSSLRSSTNQLLRALFSTEQDARILAEQMHHGVTPVAPMPTLSAWSSESTTPIPLRASLALTPLRLRVPLTSHAAIYASIAPLIRTRQSKISFYDPAKYLSASNHRLILSTELGSTTFHETRMAHLEPSVRIVDLKPGDVLYHAPGMPITPQADPEGKGMGMEGLSLPVSPILADHIDGVAMIEAQKEAFEAGAPPPGARSEDGLVELEAPGRETDLGGVGARRAMGY